MSDRACDHEQCGGGREITAEMIERALDEEYGRWRWRGTLIEDVARQRMRAVLDVKLNEAAS